MVNLGACHSDILQVLTHWIIAQKYSKEELMQIVAIKKQPLED